MDDEEAFLQPTPNTNFRIEASKSSRQTSVSLFTLDNPLAWTSQQLELATVPYVNHLVAMNRSSTIVAGFSSPSDSLRLFNVTEEGLVPQRALHTHQDGISAIKVDPQDSENIVWSCGSDGQVLAADLRVANGGTVCSLQGAFNKTRPFLSMDISKDGTVAAGTEEGGEDASIVYWDKRNPSKPISIHTSTHSQDINLLSFNPTAPRLLLSGAADGLLSITDVLEPDEDEAVRHVRNWGCSISKAGWAGEAPKQTIWSTSDMETMATWSEELDLVKEYGDVRNTSASSWKTDYIIGAEWMDSNVSTPWGVSGVAVWCGNNQGDLALLLQNEKDLTEWHLERVLQGGHSEIVRSVCVDSRGGYLLTGAEDGKIVMWDTKSSGIDRSSEDMEMASSSPPELRRKRSDEFDSKVLKRRR